MKRNFSLSAFILGSSIFILSGCSTKAPSTTMSEPPATVEPTSNKVASDQPVMKSTRYVEFSPEVLETSKNGRRVLFFYANWCPICKPADESFTKNAAQLPDDVTLIRVNYNDTDTDQTEKDLAKKYGVTYQHTFVQIDSNGEKVTIWNGGEIDELLSKLK